MVRVAFSVVVVVLSLAACGGPKLADCEQIATSQDACMDDESLKACKAANDACGATADGEVLVLESCPLQFSCAEPRGTSGLAE